MTPGESRSFGLFAWTRVEPPFIVQDRFRFRLDCRPMTSAAPCLSIDLQFPVALEPLSLDPDSLQILRQAVQVFGEFQQPYAALIEADDPGAGTTDATVEISSGRLQDGPPVIILDDDSNDKLARYLVLEEQWHDLPAGTLLFVSGSAAAVVSSQETTPEHARAEAMLTFLDLLPVDPGAGDFQGACLAGADRDAPDPFVQSLLVQLRTSTPGSPVTEATLALWRGRLPDALLALCQRDGLARYHDDRLTMVNPERYAALLDAFLAGDPLRGKDSFHVYAISPFGQMLICGERTGVELTLEPHEGYLCAPAAMTVATSSIDRSRRLHDFLLTLDDSDLDVLAEDGEPMFWRAREMLGPLGDGEVYTSTEPVAEYGWRLSSLVKRKALDVLAELARRR